MPDPQIPVAKSFTQFFSMLEEGQLVQDVTEALSDIAAALNDYVQEQGGGRPKAKLAITIGFKLEDGTFVIDADYKVTKPTAPRRRSMAWSTPENKFTPVNPRQMTLFAPRAVDDGEAEARRI